MTPLVDLPAAFPAVAALSVGVLAAVAVPVYLHHLATRPGRPRRAGRHPREAPHGP